MKNWIRLEARKRHMGRSRKTGRSRSRAYEKKDFLEQQRIQPDCSWMSKIRTKPLHWFSTDSKEGQERWGTEGMKKEVRREVP